MEITITVDFEEGQIDLQRIKDQIDRELILGALEHWAGQKGFAATSLGRSRRWLWLRSKELGIEEEINASKGG